MQGWLAVRNGQPTKVWTLAGRTAHRDEIEAWISEWIRARPRSEALASIEAAGLGVGPIQSIGDISKDPHLAVRDLRDVDDPILGKVRMPQTLPVVSGGAEHHTAAPMLGQHTHQVLSELLGYSDGMIAAVGNSAAQ